MAMSARIFVAFSLLLVLLQPIVAQSSLPCLGSILERNMRDDSLLRLMHQCIDEHPDADIPPVVLETYASLMIATLMRNDAIALEPLLDEYVWIDSHLADRTFMFPESEAEFSRLRMDLAAWVTRSLGSCQTTMRTFGQGSTPDPIMLGRLFVGMQLTGCEASPYMDTVANHLAASSGSVYLRRRVAEYLLAQNRYDLAAHITEDNASNIQNLKLRAREWLTLADIYKMKGDFFAARIFAEKANEDYPEWGYPYLFLAKLYPFSAPFCEFSAFERKALNWLSIENCRKAMDINQNLRNIAQENISKYESNLPTRDECFINGLRQGSTFLIGCWINESVRIIY